MDAATPRPQSTLPPRRKGPPAPLRIDTPIHNKGVALFASDSSSASASASTLSSTTSDADSFILPSPSKPRSLRNMKKLSITLPSAHSSTNSLALPAPAEADPVPPTPSLGPKRRPSVISLPNTSTNVLRRKGEDGDGSPTVPYADGPAQILPGIWLGSEDNVRDWRGLMERGIKSVLNVAKEVQTDFDQSVAQSMRPFMSTPDLNATRTGVAGRDATYYPAHLPSGRPAMHYLKLHWSHGQDDLVQQGFPAAFQFVDRALERGDGVLVHCQCGVSRSATLVIALVMRAAAQRSSSVPSEVWALKGMQGAYSFVKEKSKWIGPNMSLIYQLLDYERTLKAGDSSPTPSELSAEEEWGRRRLAMEDTDAEDDRESMEIMREAKALDQAMEDRILARQSSSSSLGSTGHGLGMGAAWRSKYGSQRGRKGSAASIVTNGSVLSEDLVEEDEEEELLGVRRNFDDLSLGAGSSSAEPTEDESSSESSTQAIRRAGAASPPQSGSLTARRPPGLSLPPSAPAHKSKFTLPPVPVTAVNTLKNTPPRAKAPPAGLATPSQTLFVFPPSPTFTARTPSTLTITSNAYPFPPMSTPRVSTFKSGGARRSFIGLTAPATPTVASSRVDVRGYLA
ncbi:phosphatases II [Trametes sanguinea]|nr:phosphatases II [Trametes sanguinea]